MLIISGVLSLSVVFVPQLILFVPLALALLILVIVTEHAETQGGGALFGPGFSRRAFLSSAFRLINPRLLFFWSATYVCLLLLAGMIFVSMPRFRLDRALPFLKAPARHMLTGFTDNIRFGEVTDIAKDDSVALRVDVPAGTDFEGIPYWRMAILDEYTGEGFRVSASAKTSLRSFNDRELRVRADMPGDAQTWTFYLEGGTSRYLPTPDAYARLRFSNIIKISINLNTLTVSTDELGGSLLPYQVKGAQITGISPAMNADQQLNDVKLQSSSSRNNLIADHRQIRYPFTTLALPAPAQDREYLKQAVREIARSRGLTKRDPRAFAAAAEAWLAERHSYSMESSLSPGASDPLIRWMTSREPGHCELFAGAEIMLMRSAGYPSRMVTGFAGADLNSYEGYLTVRNSNAHAWVEVFDQTLWFRTDPTPGGGAASSGGWTAAQDTGFAAYVDSLRVLWYRHVIHFDSEQQMRLANYTRSLSLRLRNALLGFLGDNLRQVRMALENPIRLSRYLALMRNLLLIILLWILVRRWVIRLNARRGAGQGGLRIVADPVRRKAGRLLAAFPVSVGGTDERAAAMREALQVIRFGPRELWPQSPARIFCAARRMRREFSRRS
jgi:transglutaminase-like putative cysteine protease